MEAMTIAIRTGDETQKREKQKKNRRANMRQMNDSIEPSGCDIFFIRKWFTAPTEMRWDALILLAIRKFDDRNKIDFSFSHR